MTEKFQRLTENFVEGGKTEIKPRLMRLLFASNFLTFLTLITISLFGIFICWSVISYQNERLTESTAEYTENFLENEMTTQLKRIVTAKSLQINVILTILSRETEFIADQMTVLSKHPQNYTEKIIAEKLTETGNFYQGRDINFFVGTKENHLISEDKIISAVGKYPQKIWYEIAKNSTEIEFTEIYNTGEILRLACAKAYKDAENNFAGVAAIDFALEEIADVIVKRVKSAENIFFVIDKNGKIILTSLNEEFFKFDTPEIIEKMHAGKNEVDSIEIDGKEYFIAFAPIKISGWIYAELINKERIIAPAKIVTSEVENQMEDLNTHLNKIFARLIFAILILSIIALILLRLYSRKQTEKFVAPILELSDGVRDIASGDFDKKLEISTNDEIEHLAICFNSMTDELKIYMENKKKVTADKERISTELKIAEDIQLSMLPKIFDFGRADFEIYATMNAAKEVGGDFYDFYLLDENHLVITIADVSGKGVPAALFMVVSKTILKNFSMTMKNSEDLAAAVTCTNQQLCKNNDEMLFVTIFTGILNLQTGKLTYVNAAHESLIFYSARREKFEYIKSAKRNYSLGLMEDIEYEQETLQLEPGDIIFQYTDGVTEAMNENRKLFGEERLLAALNELPAKKISVEEILGGLRKAVASFVKTAPQSDDITIIGVRYKSSAD